MGFSLPHGRIRILTYSHEVHGLGELQYLFSSVVTSWGSPGLCYQNSALDPANCLVHPYTILLFATNPYPYSFFQVSPYGPCHKLFGGQKGLCPLFLGKWKAGRIQPIVLKSFDVAKCLLKPFPGFFCQSMKVLKTLLLVLNTFSITPGDNSVLILISPTNLCTVFLKQGGEAVIGTWRLKDKCLWREYIEMLIPWFLGASIYICFILQRYRKHDWGLPFVSLSGSLGYARHIRNLIALSVFIKLSFSSLSAMNASTENHHHFYGENQLNSPIQEHCSWKVLKAWGLCPSPTNPCAHKSRDVHLTVETESWARILVDVGRYYGEYDGPLRVNGLIVNGIYKAL